MTAHAKKTFTTVVVVAMAAVAAHGGTIVSNAFNSGSLPGGDWTFNNDVTLTGPESPISGVGGGASLNAKQDGPNGTTPRPEILRDLDVSGADRNEPLVIEFDFYSGRPGQTIAQVFFLRQAAGTGGSSLQGIQLNMESGTGDVQYHDGSGMKTIGSIANDTWYHYKITAVAETNAVGDTFDLLITDSVGATVISTNGLSFKNDINNYAQAQWYNNTAATGFGPQFYLDNVHIWTSAISSPPVQPPVDDKISAIIDEQFNGTPGSFYAFESFDLLSDLTNDLSTWTFVENGSIIANDGPNAVDPFGTLGFSLNIDMTINGVPRVDIPAAPSGADTNQQLAIRFSFNPADFSAAHELALRGNNDVTTGIQMDLASPSGEVRNHDGAAMQSLGFTLTEGEWYHFELMVDPESNPSGDTFDLTILNTNLTVVFSTNGLPFKVDLATYDKARFYYNTGTPTEAGQYYIDNVLIRTMPDAFADSGVDFANGAEQTGAESTFDPNVLNGTSVFLEDTDYGTNPEADAFFTVDNPDEPLHIVFDYYPILRNGANFGFRLRDDTQLDDTTSFDTQGMDGIRLMDNFGDAGIQNKPAPADPWVTLLAAPTEGEWHTVEIIASPESEAVKTFDINLYDQNGDLVGSATDQPFRFSITNYTSFGFFFNNPNSYFGGNRYQVDNLRIGTSVPCITDMSVDGSGNVILDFTGTAGRTYIVTKTDDLSSGFSDTTNSDTTDGSGVGQATVPAAELVGSDEYFFGLND